MENSQIEVKSLIEGQMCLLCYWPAVCLMMVDCKVCLRRWIIKSIIGLDQYLQSNDQIMNLM